MPEKKQNLLMLEKEIFTPALQQAVKAATDKQASRADIISAAGNAYMNMVIMLTGGPEHAAGILQALVDYLKTAKESD